MNQKGLIRVRVYVRGCRLRINGPDHEYRCEYQDIGTGMGLIVTSWVRVPGHEYGYKCQFVIMGMCT